MPAPAVWSKPGHVLDVAAADAATLKISPPSKRRLRKPEAEAYDHVVNAIGLPASRIVFFDDSADNIAGARARGLTAVHVTSPDDVAKALAALGI